MLSPLKVVDIELSHPLATIEGLDGYMGVHGFVRLHGVPIGFIEAPIKFGCCEAATLSKLILEQHSSKIIQQLLVNGLAAPPKSEGLCLKDLFDVPPLEYEGALPLVTVAVCTRDRPSDLALCLDALCKLDYAALDLLVIDNAPSSDDTEHLVQRYPNIRYIREPRPGLDWARNRAILEAQGEIIAYTDDDVVVDPGWVKALVKVFTENLEVMAVTGLVVPYELETDAQVLFEMSGGFGKGFERQWHRVARDEKMRWHQLGTGNFGTGANMAYRCSVFNQIGYFDPALDVGTVTNGAGDCEMFFRVLKEGHTLAYEPSAVIRHCHRRDYEKLRRQLSYNGAAYSYMVRSVLAYPDEFFSFVKLGLIWLLSWHLRRLFISFMHPTRFPRDLILAELQGCFVGLGRYQQAQKIAAQIAETFGPLTPVVVPGKSKRVKVIPKHRRPIGVRTVELTQPIQALTDVTGYSRVRVFVTWNGSPLGNADVTNQYQQISASHLHEAIANTIGLKLIEPGVLQRTDSIYAEAVAMLSQHYTPIQEQGMTASYARLPVDNLVSVVIATYDRPEDLRNCLRCLVVQDSPRTVEIIVVDNHPASGLTLLVVSEFPSVKLVREPRQGVNYARNAGIAASTGDVVAIIDDDVNMASDWLEKLVAPFSRADVMAVAGNILPRELETYSQCLFEQYGDGGLGRGFNQFEVNGNWFEKSWLYAVRTWLLGGTANSAFRASIFSHPNIGLTDEALGPGMPSGAGEDIYIFYKVLKAGYTIVYNPTALVWHKHRRDMSALRHQLYNYSKGFVSYHLTTVLRDHDLRGLIAVISGLPIWQIWRIKERLLGHCPHPILMILLDVGGNLAGPWSLWRSHQRVKREGRSSPYIPVQERSQKLEHSQQTEEIVQSSVGVNAYGG